MLRPSRPMMRPFMSSLGRSTTETVVSMACSAALRWMASVMICCARGGGGLARLGLEPLDQVGGVAAGVRLRSASAAARAPRRRSARRRAAARAGGRRASCSRARRRRRRAARCAASGLLARAQVLLEPVGRRRGDRRARGSCRPAPARGRRSPGGARAPAVRPRRRARAPSRGPRAAASLRRLSASRSACWSSALGFVVGACSMVSAAAAACGSRPTRGARRPRATPATMRGRWRPEPNGVPIGQIPETVTLRGPRRSARLAFRDGEEKERPRFAVWGGRMNLRKAGGTAAQAALQASSCRGMHTTRRRDSLR